MDIVQVEAVGVAFASGTLGLPIQQKQEKAMLAAIQKAQSEGISDPEIIRARVLMARDGIKE